MEACIWYKATNIVKECGISLCFKLHIWPIVCVLKPAFVESNEIPSPDAHIQAQPT